MPRRKPRRSARSPFLYRHIIGRQIGNLGEVIRARKPKPLPVVMTREEVKALLSHLQGDKWLMASLMDGVGLRLMECLRRPNTRLERAGLWPAAQPRAPSAS